MKENHVISYYKIRRAVGLIGILLPFVLLLGNYLLNECGLASNEKWIFYTGKDSYETTAILKSSISHFYYTAMGEVFTGSLCAVALFLFCYKGYPKPASGPVRWFPGDNAMANSAALFALIVVLFPTSEDMNIKDNFRSFVSTDLTGYIHYGFAALFFIALAFMSIINFRRTGDPNLFGKMKSHPIYLWCGIIMLACLGILAAIFLLGKLDYDTGWADDMNLTYWLETVMLVAFGTSWLIKGKVDQRVFKKNVFGHGKVKPKASVKPEQ